MSECVECGHETHSLARRACILLHFSTLKILRDGVARREGNAVRIDLTTKAVDLHEIETAAKIAEIGDFASPIDGR